MILLSNDLGKCENNTSMLYVESTIRKVQQLGKAFLRMTHLSCVTV